ILAMLFAITSRFLAWAFMPVAAMASALIGFLHSNLHLTDLAVGRDSLVADRERRLQCALRRHHPLDYLSHIGLALDARRGERFRAAQRLQRAARRLGQRGAEI